LANSSLTIDNGFEVFVDGFFLHVTTDYTVSHAAASTTITFLNRLFDTQTISVIYDITPTVSTGATGVIPLDTQLFNNEIIYFGDTVTLRVVTDDSYSKWGDATESTADTENLAAVVNDFNPEETKDTEAIYLGAEKRFFFQNAQTSLSNGNRVIFDSITYEIIRVIKHTAGGVTYCIEVWGKRV